MYVTKEGPIYLVTIMCLWELFVLKLRQWRVSRYTARRNLIQTCWIIRKFSHVTLGRLVDQPVNLKVSMLNGVLVTIMCLWKLFVLKLRQWGVSQYTARRNLIQTCWIIGKYVKFEALGLSASESEGGNVEWRVIRDTFTNASWTYLGHKEPNRKFWISDGTWNLIDERCENLWH